VGTDFHDEGAEAFVNNSSVGPAWAAGMFDCDCDIPLMMAYDYRTAPPLNVVEFYRVIAAYCGSAGAPSVDWQASSLQVIHFYA